MLSEKQRIYLEILKGILPYVRNVETWGLWRRLRFGNAYPEAELVHNLPRCLEEPTFGREDIWWLNAQARNYCQGAADRPCKAEVTRLVRNLFYLVPSELREQLKWDGPNGPQFG